MNLAVQVAVVVVGVAAQLVRLAERLLPQVAAVVALEPLPQERLPLQPEAAVDAVLAEERVAGHRRALLPLLMLQTETALRHAHRLLLVVAVVEAVVLAEVRCRARMLCRTKRHCTALPSTVSTRSSSSLPHTAPI